MDESILNKVYTMFLLGEVKKEVNFNRKTLEKSTGSTDTT